MNYKRIQEFAAAGMEEALVSDFHRCFKRKRAGVTTYAAAT